VSSHCDGSHPCPARSGGIDSDVLHVVEDSSSVQPFVPSSLPVSSFIRVFQPPARCSLLRPLLTFRAISCAGSPQVRTRCFRTRPHHLPPRLNRWISLCRASSSHHVGFLWCSCSSACPFRLAFLPPRSVTLPELASTSNLIFMFPCFGSFTGDSHPFCNAPMLGAHKALQRTRPSHPGCNRTSSWAGSLSCGSLGNSDAYPVSHAL
jgi:hypothetical protein